MNQKIFTTHMSDNHNNYTTPVGKGNILFHTGDATRGGTEKELLKLASFFEASLGDFDHIVYVPGNHDRLFQDNESLARSLFKHFRIHILINQSVELCGFKIYGCPYTRDYNGGAFMKTGEELNSMFETIIRTSDILLTHSPPWGILDYTLTQGHLGSQYLAYVAENMKDLKLHSFGHIHECYGAKEKDGKLYLNTALAGTGGSGPFSPIRVEWIDNKIVAYGPIEEIK